ncbi:MAG: hypothetical protein H7Z43_01550 [Clostridia bacterium]|nr:hypothetical protein [Deltaproteobacteria bacterium]
MSDLISNPTPAAPSFKGVVEPAAEKTDLVPVVNPAGLAQTQHAVDSLRAIAYATQKGVAATQRDPLTFIGFGIVTITATLPIPWTLIGVGAVLGGEFGAGAALLAYSAASSAVALTAFIAPQLCAWARANQRVDKMFGARAPAITERLASATGLEKAWIAVRCGDLSDHLCLGAKLKAASLEGIALEGIAEADRATARTMNAAYKLVFDPTAGIEHANDPAQGHDGIRPNLESRMPQLLHTIELLPQTARELLALSIRDSVLLELGDGPDNALLGRRFVEALQGKRTPYASKEFSLETARLGETLDEIRARKDDVLEPVIGAARKIHAMIQQQAASGQQIKATSQLPDQTCAEHVGSFFERRSYRASITGSTVTVYDPELPPT